MKVVLANGVASPTQAAVGNVTIQACIVARSVLGI